MRKLLIALVVVTLFVGLAATTAGARPHTATLSAPVTGYVATPGTDPVPFTGTLTVDRFVEAEGQLTVEGRLVPDAAELFEPLMITVVVLAASTLDETTSACTVQISTATTVVEGDPTIVVEGAGALFAFESGRELCRVVRTINRNPDNLSAVARALNTTLGLG